jgi:hypothetical protein
MKRSEMTLAQKLAADKKPKPLRSYTLDIVTNPTTLEITLGTAKVERKTVTIEGTSLADAKRRAGIQ